MEKLTQLGRKLHIFASKGPAYYYAYSRWRLNNWLQKKSNHSFELSDDDLLAAIDWQKLSHSSTNVNNGNATPALITHFHTRTNPLFFFQDGERQKVTALIGDEQQESTIKAADEVCENNFTFRGVGPVNFDNGIDWFYRPQGNIDWTWDLNRHAYFETLGRAYSYTNDEKYAQKFCQLLLDWLAHNPAGIDQPNWSSVFEAGYRINTWIWAFYYFRSTVSFDQEVSLAFLKGLLTHGRYLNTNIELHVPNNHLLLEAKALALLGILFPEFQEARSWHQRGLQLLYRQLKAQVCADGIHGERATHYHRVIASELLELLVLMENNQLPAPTEIVDIFRKMFEFELWITKPDGLIPLLNDSALADTYLRFLATIGGAIFLKQPDLQEAAPPLDEATSWLLGPKRIAHDQHSTKSPAGLASRAFPEGGYFIMRHGSGPQAAYLAFDCGPFGYKPLPSHGHADALNLELYAYGQTWLVDPGVYSTSLGQNWRNFFRGSRAHNTIVVDNEDQSMLLDTRRVYRPAQASLHRWITNKQFDFVDGSHNGYKRLLEPVTHRRQIFFVKREYWIIVDVLTGQGKHTFDLYFHLTPDIEVRLNSNDQSARIENKNQRGLLIAPLTTNTLQSEIIEGTTEPIQGWVSFFSGEKQAAPTLRYRQEEITPVQFCTILYPYANKQHISVSVSSLALEIEKPTLPYDQLTGLRIDLDKYTDYLLLDRATSTRTKRFAEYETDAQIFYSRHEKENGEPVNIITERDQRPLFQGQPLSI